MRTRRDQVQAYRFVVRRTVSALLSGEPEATERPMRKLGWSVFASAMVTVLVMAVAGIWGLVTGQGRDLVDGSLVIDSESRARYVYVEGVLYPVRNLASARLILGGVDHEEREVTPSTLEGVPRGNIAGIPGAPDGPPTAAQLVDLPWHACNVPPTGDESSPRTVVVAGQELTGGRSPGDTGVYLADDEHEYLLWRDRLLTFEGSIVPVALGVSAVQPTVLDIAMRNALATGPDLDVVRPEGFEEPVDYEIGGEPSAVGYLYLTNNQHYVMTRDGLRPIGEFVINLRTSIGVAKIRDITGGEVTALLASNEPIEPAGFPLETPEVMPADDTLTVCAAYRGPVDDDRPAATVDVFDAPPPEVTAGHSIQLLQTERDSVPAAAELILPSGKGALVQEATLRGTAGSGDTIYLITPEGIKYPLGGSEAQAALGYEGVDPQPVPGGLLGLIPTSVPLTVADARDVVDTGTQSAAG